MPNVEYCQLFTGCYGPCDPTLARTENTSAGLGSGPLSLSSSFALELSGKSVKSCRWPPARIHTSACLDVQLSSATRSLGSPDLFRLAVWFTSGWYFDDHCSRIRGTSFPFLVSGIAVPLGLQAAGQALPRLFGLVLVWLARIIFHRHRLHRAPEVPRTTSSSSLRCSGPQLRTGS